MLHPLVTPLELPGTALDMRFTGLRHASGPDIVPHWLPVGAGRGVLLRVDYPELPAPERHARPLDAQALGPAAWRGRELLGVVALAFPVLLSITIFTRGSSWSVLLQTLAIGGIALGLMVGCLRLWQRRVEARRAEMTVVHGTVSEVLAARISTGRTSRVHTWYRVGDLLVCPGAARSGTAGIGSRVRVEILHGEAADGDDTLAAFVVESDTAVPAIEVPVR